MSNYIRYAKMFVMPFLLAMFVAGCGNGESPTGDSGSGSGPGPAGAAPSLGAASSLGSFGGSGGGAGLTNTGVLTVINGDLGSTTTTTSSFTGFHDSAGDVYTETGSNIGNVTGLIYTCTTSTTGPTAAAVNTASCDLATAAAADANLAFIDLRDRVGGLAVETCPGCGGGGAGELGGRTLAPGIYKSTPGSFDITLGDLTLDAGGNADAVWVFQMDTTLTVGGAAVTPKSVTLTNLAQAKNVFWQVGSAASINEINAGGTMVGTILAGTALTISTVGQTELVTLNGRAISLGAQGTINNTVINIP